MLLSVKSLIWTGGRVNPAKYSRLPREERMKGYKHVDLRNDERPFELLPKSCVRYAWRFLKTRSRLRRLSIRKMWFTSLALRMAAFHR